MDKVILIIGAILVMATPMQAILAGIKPVYAAYAGAFLTALGALSTYLAREVPGRAERAVVKAKKENGS